MSKQLGKEVRTVYVQRLLVSTFWDFGDVQISCGTEYFSKYFSKILFLIAMAGG